jgi:hypothetical protein
MASYPISYKPHATGTRIDVPSAGGLAPIEALQSGKIVANPRGRRGARVESARCVGLHSSNPSLCSLRLDTEGRRPPIRSCRQRFRTLRRGWVSVQGSTTDIRLVDVFQVKPTRICSLPFRLRNYAINLRRATRRNTHSGCTQTSLTMRR